MSKSLITFLTAASLTITSQTFAFCDDFCNNFCSIFTSCGSCGSTICYSADVEAGWRRDFLDWKTKDKHGSYFSGDVDDTIEFNDINSYMVSGELKCVSSDFYLKASADYGWVYKGREHEHFKIESYILNTPLSAHTSNPIKRSSEVYDFSAAIGYPLAYCNCRLSIIPLLGFSFHRQHLVSKENGCSSGFSFSSSGQNDNKEARQARKRDRDLRKRTVAKRNKFKREREFFRDHSSSSFFVSNDANFNDFPFSNPFSSDSDTNIAGALGLSNPHDTDSFRFTWYGFYMGADLAYALDNCWTLYWNTEFHFLDNCHRKRKSWTGVYFVDDYHNKGGAYGFNNSVGLNVNMCNNWYGTVSVDFNWWKASSYHDDLHWKKVDVKAGLAYGF